MISYYVIPGIRNRASMRRVIKPDRVLSVVAGYFNMAAEDITRKTRRSEIVRPRQIAMYLTKHMTALTLREIGMLFGDKDHSMVHHNIKTVMQHIAVDANYRNLVNEIESLI